MTVRVMVFGVDVDRKGEGQFATIFKRGGFFGKRMTKRDLLIEV